MELSISGARQQEATDVSRSGRYGGAALVAFGVALLADLMVFAAYVSATGVTVKTDNPAADPTNFARQLVSGAGTAFWAWYILLGLLAACAIYGASVLNERLRAAGSRLPSRQLGTSALALYVVIALLSATIDRQAGSAVLTRGELTAAIPVLFGVVVPTLLASFNLLVAGWIAVTSFAGWRTSALPRWLAGLGGLTAVVLLGGVTGQAGFEILTAPWLVATGVWMFASAPRAAVSR